VIPKKTRETLAKLMLDIDEPFVFVRTPKDIARVLDTLYSFLHDIL
jgi:hypothetical protein